MKILYLGLDPSRYPYQGELTHLPLIKIVPRPFDEAMKCAFAQLDGASHVLFTSRSAVGPYQEYALKAGCSEERLQEKIYLCVGRATAAKAKEKGFKSVQCAQEETAEGMIALFATLDLQDASFFFPRSAQGRSLLIDYFFEKKITLHVVDLYDTVANQVQMPDLDLYDSIIFTSPSVVKIFFELVVKKPPLAKCHAIGPVTEKSLKEFS